MNVTAIQPAKFQIRKFHYELAESIPPTFVKFKGGDPESYSIGAGVGYLVPPSSKESNLCGILITLEFHLKPDPEGATPSERFKTVEIDCEGFFVVPRTVPASYIDRAFLVNCYTILFGTLRGYVHTATGSIQGGPLVLPGVVMDEIIESAPLILNAIQELQAQLISPGMEEAPSPKGLARKVAKPKRSLARG